MFSRLVVSRLISSRTFVTGANVTRSSKMMFGTAVATCAVGAGIYSTMVKEPIHLEKAAATTSIAGTKGGVERTFIAIKPDGTQRGLVGEVISRFEKRGYKLVAIKSLVPSKALAEEHYADLSARPFFKGLVNYMTSGKAPIIAMVWEGKDAIRQGRRIVGATNPLESAPGTIRGDYCISIGRNIIHASDGFETATQEIGLWFKKEEIVKWSYANEEWINSDN
ncbi:nucleoside diphosphate kinase [Phlyctochytrium planicorne]|nr:nucleoside diphosphate kinase [Phlyctochytrium planicorne]